MKKYIIFFFSIFLLLLNITYAYEIDLNNEIISFDKIENFNLQGFTTTDKYLFLVLVERDDKSSIIMIYNLDDYKLVKTIFYSSLGHANDVTYNRKTNKIYVLRGNGSSLVDVFNGESFQYEETIDVKLPIRSITYVDTKDEYYVRTVATGFRLDNKFKLASKIPFVIGMNFNNDIGRQGWQYYNGYIYYANWSWVRLGGDGSNIIYIYNLEGKEMDYLHTSRDIGEIEGISFYKDKMILGFNGYDNKVKFYIRDIPPVLEKEKKEKINNDKEEIKNYNILIYIVLIFLVVSLCLIVKKKMCK